ncbi:DEAD/DEAH box helicase [Endothiovibrio diazotrophicus]
MSTSPSFSDLDLDPKLLRAVEACGFTDATDIQREAIPVALAGRDLMASAQTGTGKTAAFVLPTLNRLLQPPKTRGHGPRVLVLTPTRELATQVSESVAELGRFQRLRFTSVVGGVPYPPQIRMLSAPLDILVATPGRLMDHMERGRVDFSRLEVLILDEADRMLDMGFVDEVKKIAAATPSDRQTLLFSATLEGPIEAVARELLNDPAQVQVAGVKVRHESIEQRLHQADDLDHKHALLDRLVSDPELSQAVIFTATKRAADELADLLREAGHHSAALHGDMQQGARRRTIERMKRGQVRLLVATDVAARGLDIKGLSHVINFDLPMAAEDYIHRIGRTGRGGASGTAISLVGPRDWGNVQRIERLTGQKVERHVLEGLEPRRPEPRLGGRDGKPGQKKFFSKGGPRRGGPSGGGPGGGNGRRSFRDGGDRRGSGHGRGSHAPR